ncbi:hypothetical protein OHA72_48055 [Dactylosporangium sp. NBC_01737]|uniref:hypothetical protein n=1 Tax=Dactylosporangium sp. NBC_01737 TaxID=2975959 RepID=UPI002E10378F|nr:hypothetical protein OHA72_48055 [Dactylosporangium sp. NBC_01737]
MIAAVGAAERAAARGVQVNLVPDRDAASILLRGWLPCGDVVLVKGSNSVGLLKVAAELTIGLGPRRQTWQ